MSQVVDKLNEIQKFVHLNLLKELGFRKKGRTWNRSFDGIIQAINFQVGQYPIGQYEISGLRESLYGYFTVNMGIFIPEAYEFEFGEKPKEFMQESSCHIRSRFSQLVGSKKEMWWDLSKDTNLICENIMKLILEVGLPFLDSLKTRDLIIKNAPRVCKKYKLSNRYNIEIGLIYYKMGDTQKAKKYFRKQYDESDHKAHKEYLIELAKKLGFEF